ncbi:hypothetical protein GCM10011321_13890 [Youhaiella tibetensis]|uniref:DUF192 domain-containing protein n=1 Tax=Paradevosia tibetensis TaxID=1447062 RepID=A0A5B9DMA7_9HYPH|nr:DUF192 domain-containing protein [Youhaiella tibetensis]QEE20481.1 DUF192 domain-containing protein [Youhaiella tibetensis]GGF23785.1 hypothetical protein GCM10011321_13890 [Youhaiella tibetensis]
MTALSLESRSPVLAATKFCGLAFAAVIAFLPLAACSDETKAVLHTATGNYTFNVEVVDTDATRAKGLMFRQELPKDDGMLFDFLTERNTSFWMQNTFIPLDMIFIGADGTVKTIHENARPFDTTPIPSQVPVRYVLEIAGGRSDEIGLKVGDTFEHDRIKK